MKKTLILLRHGKAEGHSADGDFARELTHRGEEDAEKAGKHIFKEIATPDLIMTSDAARAQSTAKIAAKAARYAGKLVLEHGIYEASTSDLAAIVRGLPSTAASAVIVGHNPGLEELVHLLADDWTHAPGLGTACFTRLEFDVDEWSAVEDGAGRIAGVFAP